MCVHARACVSVCMCERDWGNGSVREHRSVEQQPLCVHVRALCVRVFACMCVGVSVCVCVRACV